MNGATYTPEVMAQAGLIYDKLDHHPQDKRLFASAIAEAFINGMNAKERLMAKSQHPADQTSA